MTPSIGKCRTETDFVVFGVCAVFMVIPGGAVVTGVFGRERGLGKGGGGQPLSFRTG